MDVPTPETQAGELPHIPELAQDYELIRELGRGGTAIVYLAREREPGRDVAIKLIRPGYLHDEDAIARLVREARTVGKLQHPSIVMLLGTRRLGDYGLALILQYVPGETLKHRIEARGQLSISDCERVLRDLGGALQYAHAQRIVHRDIKPENVYLDDASKVARLADFGIAKAWDSDSGLTLPGSAIGTPAYMSPEQVDGQELDGRSDIYSLGLLGYEMLTGRQPWAGESLYSVIYKQKHEDLPAIAGVRPETPKNLQRAIEGAIRKEPDERWPNADKFLEALADGSTLSAASEGAPETVESEAIRTSGAPASALEAVEAAVAAQEAASSTWQLGTTQKGVAAQGQASSGPWTPRERTQPRRGRRILAGAVALAAVAAGVFFLMDSGSVSSLLERVGFPSNSDGSAGAFALGGGPPQASSAPSRSLIPNADGATPTGEEGAIGDAVLGAGVPSSVQSLGGDLQVAPAGTTLPLPLVVRVTDRTGVGVAGVTVAFEVLSGGGAAEPSTGLTGPDGTVISRWTLGVTNSEPQSLRAHAGDLELGEVVFRAVPEGLSPNGSSAIRAEVLGGAGQQGTAGALLPQDLTVRLLDQEGSPVPGAVVRFVVESGDGQVTPEMAQADEQGVARSSWALGELSGVQVARAEVDGVPEATVRFEATARLASLVTVPAVVTGGTHSCSLRPAGTMVCWGGNAGGQLGQGSPAGSLVPGSSVEGSGFSKVVSGLAHVCALNLEGQALCWGSNEQGQLGTGGSASTSLPSSVLRSGFVSLAAGLAHTCGLDAAGSAYCWGANDAGQLGDGSQASTGVPTAVLSSVAFGEISAGWRHTCALDGGGRAYCWGANDSGQLGTPGGASSVPAPVSGGLVFRTLSAGNAHTCGLAADGRVLCWGANDGGQLGDGTNQPRSIPQQVVTTASFGTVAAGGVHTCGLTVDGGAMCWGTNVYGQLGDGTTESRNTPVPVSGFDRFSQIDAFGSHNCGRTPSGDVLCWGYNVEGQVGDGTRENRLIPTPVSSSRP